MLSILLESSLRSLLLGAIAWSLLKMLRVSNPQMQRAVWIAVLAASIAMPALMQWARVPAPASAVDWAVSAQSIEVVSATLTDWTAIVLLGYFAVAGLLLARLVFGLARSWRTCRRAQPVTAEWTGGLDIRVSEEVHAPATFASSILLPVNHVAWSDVRRTAVLTHECEHMRNRDFQVRLLAHLYRAVFWFNPLAWWLPQRLAMLGEQLSDDAAIGRVGDRVAYAQMLVDFSRSPADRLPGAFAMARRATVSARVERILESSDLPQKIGRLKAFGLASALLPLIWIVAGCSSDKSGPRESAASAPAHGAATDTSTETPTPENVVLPTSNKQIPLAAPRYPSDARRQGQAGTVVMRLHVLEDGSVDDVKIKESSGFAVLDDAAATTARTWRLDAGTIDGKPAPMWGRFAVTFKLED
ncbi:MAG TPA: M56 family metallopeptidase [Povalibacter sp.]|nr:M56 family metallopeptidase [Povalibacter sp.]